MGLSKKKRWHSSIFRDRLYEQGVFLKRLGLLLADGYSLYRATAFLKMIETDAAAEWIDGIEAGMQSGEALHCILESLYFPPQICAQIYLASIYGKVPERLINGGQWLLDQHEKRKEIKKLLYYPCVLIIFMIGMLLTMRFVLLPQMQEMMGGQLTELDTATRLVVQFIHHSPFILLGLMIVLGGAAGYFHRMLQQKEVPDRMRWWMQVPIVRDYYRLYWTDFYFSQWAFLLKSGCSFHEIVKLTEREDSTRMLRDVGRVLGERLAQGHSFHEALAELPILNKEALAVVAHGEGAGRLPSQLAVYSVKCAEEFERRMELLMEKIQPTVFVFVALMIVAIYAALMLPTFRMMEVF